MVELEARNKSTILKVIKICEVKFEPAPDGGSTSRVICKYYTKGDFKLNEEDIKAGKEKVLGLFKVVEAYLLENPNAYA